MPEYSAFEQDLRAKLEPDLINPRDIAKIAIELANGLAFLHNEGTWLKWTGHYYEPYDVQFRAEFLQVTIEAVRRYLDEQLVICDEKTVAQLGLKKIRARTTSVAFARDIEYTMRDMCLVNDHVFDTDSSIIACYSGLLNRREAHEQVIRWTPHSPEVRITKCVPLVYDPAATCPAWRAFLRSTMSEPRRFQVLLGYALAGDNTKKKRIVNLVGPTDTGKSTCLDILSEILHPYLGTMRTDEIVVSRHNARFDFHGLRNSRLVFLSEPDQHARFRIGELKRITGGEEVTTEGKGQAPIRWRASVMPFIGTNYEINFDATDEAFIRRLEYLYFDRKRPIDHDLKRKLQRERQGIFNWVLEGIIGYFNGELNDTPESIAAKERAMTAVEPPLQFLEWAISEGKIFEARPDLPAYRHYSVSRLYARYKIWHDEEFGPKPGPYGRKRFGDVVAKRYPRADRSEAGGKVTFLGITDERPVE